MARSNNTGRAHGAALIALLCWFGPTAAFTQVRVSRLDGPVYLVEDSYYSAENSLLYIGEDSVTLVGATWSPKSAAAVARELGHITHKPIREVVNTNYHPDRAGGNGYWRHAGSMIISTEFTRSLMQDRWQEVMEWTRRAIPSVPNLPLVLPTVVHQGDFQLQNGRIRAMYLGPSHTPDGIFVYFPAERILYGGCILKEQLGNLAFADLAEYPNTLRKLKALNLPIKTIIAGHWSPIHGPELIDQYLALLEAHSRAAD
jgi:metallo-beta-lactamase class B